MVMIYIWKRIENPFLGERSIHWTHVELLGLPLVLMEIHNGAVLGRTIRTGGGRRK